MRGIEFTRDNYLKGDDHGKAIATIDTSRRHWKHFEKEVKVWVEENWERWEDEKPDWFDDAMKAKVPVEFIPITGDARRRESVRRASVDADAEGVLGGAVRASIRRASVGSHVERNARRVVPFEEDN